MEETTIEEGENNLELEVAPALVAVHPLENSVAVAVGSELRVFDLQECDSNGLELPLTGDSGCLKAWFLLEDGSTEGGLLPRSPDVASAKQDGICLLGAGLRDCSVSLLDNSGGSFHMDSMRAIRFGANGRLFASAGDDKLVKIWTTDSWHCIHTVCSEKRVSAVAISHDGLFVCFADKFGVVWVVGLDVGNENQALVNKKAAPIFSHYCSIITSLEFSPNGQFIVSADRDFKIRVTVFPKNPINGAHEIQSFCLGHSESNSRVGIREGVGVSFWSGNDIEEKIPAIHLGISWWRVICCHCHEFIGRFVSCLAFVCTPDYPLGFLLSGSGDSKVCLWDFTSGSLLYACEVGAEAGLINSNGGEEMCYPAVTDLRASPDGTLVAVAIQRQDVRRGDAPFDLIDLSHIFEEDDPLDVWLGDPGEPVLDEPGDLARPNTYLARCVDDCMVGSRPSGGAGTSQRRHSQARLSGARPGRGNVDDDDEFNELMRTPRSQEEGVHDQGEVVYMGEVFIPTSVGMSAERLWMVMGASNLRGSDSPSLARMRVVSGFKKSNTNSVEPEPIVLEDKNVPGGEKLLDKLQGSVSIAIEEKAFVAAADSVKTAMHEVSRLLRTVNWSVVWPNIWNAGISVQ
ncbi:hypothetical protein HHK36_020594 [Tetracentron sinense]|uniref:Uncharacterized protein n=1 Tax=Tetracentron sinense TaxID=13715 RepID=A0A834YZ98_TETSI|nr:hypothetical protein HHK36_020594 [Tetracentron sinense]